MRPIIVRPNPVEGRGYKMSARPTKYLPENIRKAMNIDVAPQAKAIKICLYNFESSSIAADTVSSYAFVTSDAQIHTIVDRNVPAWINDSIDVIIMSYSGDSQEIDEVYNGAKRRTSRIHCITSGGKLKDLCEQGDDDLILIPEGLSNSEATGYEIGVLVNLYEALGVDGIRAAMEEALPRIIEYRDSVWDSDQARYIATRMKDKIPIIYCIGEMRAVHKRWKMLINQVPCRLAFSGELPEFDHNEIVSWTEDSDNKDFIILMFKTQSDSELLDHIVGTVTTLLPEYGLNMLVLELHGKLMERGIRGIVLADAVINCMTEVA